jgi:hypothetical protein
MTIIRTSEKDWLERAIKKYKNKEPFELIDDANIGFVKNDLSSAISLLKASRDKGDISLEQIIAVLTGIGITGAGVYIVFAALAAPEPNTKLSLLIGGGIVLALTGSIGTFAALGYRFSVEHESKDGDRFTVGTK